jgi:Mrp family chromosome partitioning ATPase
MGQMLQALKNLEARSSQSATPLQPQPPPRRSPSDEQPRAPAPSSQPTQVLTPAGAYSAVVIDTAQASGPLFAPVFVAESPAVAPTLPPTTSPPKTAAVEVKSARPSPIAPGSGGAWAHSIRRMLGDPVRSQPLRQLAGQIRRDVMQTDSKTVLLVAIGPQTAAHKPLLYTAAVLAEEAGEVLLIDANLPRRTISETLLNGQKPGLGELMHSNRPPRDSCLATELGGVWLLPAGLTPHIDLSKQPTRLEEILRPLTGAFSLVLLDGGSSADLAATTLARFCDVTYFVVQLGTVEAGLAQSALRDFRAAGARVLGCIAT